jgi:hypothetical protein
MSGTDHDHAPLRIWALHCPFRRNGSPVLGSFGSTEQPVVIMTADTWTRLCLEIPELGQRQFSVGTDA